MLNHGGTIQTITKKDTPSLDTIEQPVATINSQETRKPAMFQEVHPIQEPYVYSAIIREKETQKIRYEIIEPTLNANEEKLLREIKSFLMDEIEVNLKEIFSE
jgi:hypothetical protein